MLDSWVQAESGLTLTSVGLADSDSDSDPLDSDSDSDSGLMDSDSDSDSGSNELGLTPDGLGLWPDGLGLGLWPCGLGLTTGLTSPDSLQHCQQPNQNCPLQVTCSVHVLYAAETWTLRKRDQDRLLSFEMSCLRRILGISRRDRFRNDNIRQKLDLETTIMDRIHSRRLTYYGHVIRMCNNRLPLITLFGSTIGTKPKGRPPKR